MRISDWSSDVCSSDLSVYRSFEDVADFREELDRLERDLPGEGQLPLPGAEVVPLDKNAGKGKKKGSESLFPQGSRQPNGHTEKLLSHPSLSPPPSSETRRVGQESVRKCSCRSSR